eukprot:gene16503-22731_t
MAAVNVTTVNVLDNPAGFSAPFSFEIGYECLYDLKDDLEWKMIYVGSAESEKYDQVLDSVLVGPVYAGNYRFVFEGNPPDLNKLPPEEDIVGVTVVLLTCSYKGKEFIRIGYYVNNEYVDEELRENPPDVVDFNKLQRSILADHPRVTRFPVDFDSTSTVAADEMTDAQPEGADAEMDGVDETAPQQPERDQQQQQQHNGAAVPTAATEEMVCTQPEGDEGDMDGVEETAPQQPEWDQQQQQQHNGGASMTMPMVGMV